MDLGLSFGWFTQVFVERLYLMYLLVLTESIMQQDPHSKAGALGEGFVWGISSYFREIMEK